jgi:hypothetical protein
MKSVAGWFLGRLGEPSTLAGASTLILVGAHAWQTHDYQSIAASVCAFGAMLFREAGAQA